MPQFVQTPHTFARPEKETIKTRKTRPGKGEQVKAKRPARQPSSIIHFSCSADKLFGGFKKHIRRTLQWKGKRWEISRRHAIRCQSTGDGHHLEVTSVSVFRGQWNHGKQYKSTSMLIPKNAKHMPTRTQKKKKKNTPVSAAHRAAPSTAHHCSANGLLSCINSSTGQMPSHWIPRGPCIVP